jgi:hypothetical protein
LFLCVIINAIATSIEKSLKNSEGVSKRVNNNIGKAIPALIEDTDTMRVMRITIRKIPRQLSVSRG